jgi:ABC-type Mn2+/Zn2+ transport system ATPase subunit
MDEPCSALDPISSAVVEDLITSLRGRYTVIAISVSDISGDRLRAFSTACILNPSVYFGLIFLSSKVYFRGDNYSDTGGLMHGPVKTKFGFHLIETIYCT